MRNEREQSHLCVLVVLLILRIVWPLDSWSAVQVPSDWITLIPHQEFSMRAPPGTIYRPQQGIDSFVGEIVGTNFDLVFDYGPFTNDMRDLEHAHGYRYEKVKIDGRDAALASGSAIESVAECTGYFVGTYIRDGGKMRGRPVSLGFFGCAKDAAAIETVWSMFRSIHIMN